MLHNHVNVLKRVNIKYAARCIAKSASSRLPATTAHGNVSIRGHTFPYAAVVPHVPVYRRDHGHDCTRERVYTWAHVPVCRRGQPSWACYFVGSTHTSTPQPGGRGMHVQAAQFPTCPSAYSHITQCWGSLCFKARGPESAEVGADWVNQ